MSKPSENEGLALMYHGLDPGDARYALYRQWYHAYFLEADVFRAHLELLREAGRDILRPAEPDPEAEPESLLPGNGILLSFDDGMLSDYDVAFPMLRDQGLSALFFVTTDVVGAEEYVDWDQLREMDAAGMAIGAHGHTHSFLSALTPREQEREMLRSHEMLANELGHPPWAFSLPGGRLDGNTCVAAREAGYKVLFTSAPLPPFRRDGIWLVGRLPIRRSWDAGAMRDFLKAPEKALPALRRGARIRQVLQSTVGPRIYDGLYQSYWKLRGRG